MKPRRPRRAATRVGSFVRRLALPRTRAAGHRRCCLRAHRSVVAVLREARPVLVSFSPSGLESLLERHDASLHVPTGRHRGTATHTHVTDHHGSITHTHERDTPHASGLYNARAGRSLRACLATSLCTSSSVRWPSYGTTMHSLFRTRPSPHPHIVRSHLSAIRLVRLPHPP